MRVLLACPLVTASFALACSSVQPSPQPVGERAQRVVAAVARDGTIRVDGTEVALSGLSETVAAAAATETAQDSPAHPSPPREPDARCGASGGGQRGADVVHRRGGFDLSIHSIRQVSIARTPSDEHAEVCPARGEHEECLLVSVCVTPRREAASLRVRQGTIIDVRGRRFPAEPRDVRLKARQQVVSFACPVPPNVAVVAFELDGLRFPLAFAGRLRDGPFLPR